MITNLKLKKSLEEIKKIIEYDIILYSGTGKYITSTCQEDSIIDENVTEFLNEHELEEYLIWDGDLYIKSMIEEEIEYILVLLGADIEDLKLARMAACQLKNLVVSENDRNDRSNFIQNILLGNMLGEEVIRRAKKLHIENRDRVVVLVDTGRNSNDIALELVKNLSDRKSLDYVVAIDQHTIAMIKDVMDVEPDRRPEVLEQLAKNLVDNIQTEAMIRTRAAYSSTVRAVTDLARAFREAKLANEVGKIFYAQKDVVFYGKLGIGRLIYQIPEDLCRIFIQEVFGDQIPEILEDEEAMSTISRFLENNLNISETARQLYVHRNTLVYRLERIEKAIGLDIRSFDDAMTFKIATMVLAHLKDSSRK